MDSEPALDFARPVAVFPLPNCVLLPRAVLPLHVFEPRYREMVADCLAGTPYIAMGLLSPGYEEKYYTNAALIEPIVCVGQIVRHEMLKDGRYNILLQGVVRAEIVTEDRSGAYRRARLNPRPATGTADSQVCDSIRARLLATLSAPPLTSFATECNWRQLVEATDLPVSDVVDYLANAASSDIETAKRFLNELDLERRSAMLFEELGELARRIAAECESGTCRPWPRKTVVN